ncbi:uncharacterized protein LOC131649688 [Vicia villosa]|uniref:uncharacterized protein LOC131649688 n=1 Tax=Vicia villosa TaxID=3911 RepID=UPI00273B9E4F|nr:uncharacterized protein LOC131649688 [Vicia villosa]
MQEVRRHFRPELLNRLDEVVVFDPLSHEQLRKVAKLQMKDVASRLAKKGIALAVTDSALDLILAESYDPVEDLLIYYLLKLRDKVEDLFSYSLLQVKRSSVKLDIDRKFSNALLVTVISSDVWIGYELIIEVIVISQEKTDMPVTLCYIMLLQ